VRVLVHRRAIQAHQRSRGGGNVHRNGVVCITALSTGHNQCHRVTDYGWDGCWLSDNAPKRWIKFDFKDRAVHPSGCNLVPSNDPRAYLLHKCVLEGPNDDSSWVQLDARDTRDRCGKSVAKTSTCLARGFFRFVRLRPTGKNSCVADHLELSQFELVGALLEGGLSESNASLAVAGRRVVQPASHLGLVASTCSASSKHVRPLNRELTGRAVTTVSCDGSKMVRAAKRAFERVRLGAECDTMREQEGTGRGALSPGKATCVQCGEQRLALAPELARTPRDRTRRLCRGCCAKGGSVDCPRALGY